MLCSRDFIIINYIFGKQKRNKPLFIHLFLDGVSKVWFTYKKRKIETMKITIITTLLLTINAIGQIEPQKVVGLNIETSNKISDKNTAIQVIYTKKNNHLNKKKPAYFLNEKLISENVVYFLDPKDITECKVDKNDIVIENVKYNGQIKIKTKDNNYQPKLISLNDLKIKYIDQNGNSTVFQIDNLIINDDYEKYLVDENHILRIVVDEFENSNEKLKFNIIKIYTRSEENIKASKQILIRGED